MHTSKPFRAKAVLFDFDGTLTAPGALDFSIVKMQIGCPLRTPVLEFIEEMCEKDKVGEAREALDRFELAAAEKSVPNEGAGEIVAFLKSKGIFVGIITRNSGKSVLRALGNFPDLSPEDFDVIVSRDDPARPKPSEDGVLLAAERLGVKPEEIVVTGDFVFDIEAGNRAGAVTVYLSPGGKAIDVPSDFTIESLPELKNIVRMGIGLAGGKLPNDLLELFLNQFEFKDPAVLVRPGVGEDTAAVDVSDEEVAILKTDPITFATDSIGRYAVLVNANDIATSGATPRWMLATILFPPGSTPSQIWKVMEELEQMCLQWDITLCGGHTEITDAVTRPVVTGLMAGTVRKNELIDKKSMKAGDLVMLTKGVAVEGTAVIAREFAERLKALGLSDSEIDACRNFLDRIGILKEAKIAARSGMATALHDVTEGGLATALEELGAAGGRKIRVDLEKIRVFPETQKICRLFGIDPMGLIGSGSLLICCPPEASEKIAGEIEAEGIEVAVIGEVLEPGKGIEALRNGVSEKWPSFDADELTRLFRISWAAQQTSREKTKRELRE